MVTKSMNKKALSPGAVHSVPADLRKVLISDPDGTGKMGGHYATRAQ